LNPPTFHYRRQRVERIKKSAEFRIGVEGVKSQDFASESADGSIIGNGWSDLYQLHPRHSANTSHDAHAALATINRTIATRKPDSLIEPLLSGERSKSL